MVKMLKIKLKQYFHIFLLVALTASFITIEPIELSAKKKPTATRKTAKSIKKDKKDKKDKKNKKKKKKKRKNRKHRRRFRTKRSYNPARTREMTREIITNTSYELSVLAGLVPIMEKPKTEVKKDSLAQKKSDLGYYDEDEDEDLDEEEYYSMEEFRKSWLKYISDDSSDDMIECGLYKQDIMNEIMAWAGTPYNFGGMSHEGIDCSAFTQRMYINAGNIRLPRTARTQISIGYAVDWDDLQFGDLVFFHTYSNEFASHVGIFLTDYLFAHSSSQHGVVVSSLKDAYYRKHYFEARRLTIHDLQRFNIANESKNNTNP